MATRRKSSKRSAKRRLAPARRRRARLSALPSGPAAPPASLDSRLTEGIALFNHQEFFRCHEVLERLWLETTGRSRDFYKGLIQAAVAFYHWSQGNPGGALSLYRSSSGYLKKYRPEHLGVDVEDFLGRFSELFAWMRRHRLRYDARLVPTIRWTRQTRPAG